MVQLHEQTDDILSLRFKTQAGVESFDHVFSHVSTGLHEGLNVPVPVLNIEGKLLAQVFLDIAF